ncbi:ribose-phosphate diphosphokinase [Brochothrix thermosphacta]|uniref:ribose-phosphate diphosphokinase n=1 Tax=Brochothrix thermosphacta TaxID=2756 RepID=UPI00265CBE2F|nr:ribose-phosphate pyrophosphokinase [Brochothrix thermosphacta]WKK69157.1 ribose-phosphate pyrophosphokinase [Brochothrix thermosphacta]
MLKVDGDKLKVFALSSNEPLAQKVADELGVSLTNIGLQRFSDGEIAINIEESVRGATAYLVQSTVDPVNDNIMELLIMIDALKRSAVKTINVVMPYFGYSRQDRKALAREPITAKLVANLIVEAGAHRLTTIDLHAAQLQGFFNIPIDHLTTSHLLADYVNEKYGQENIVVVSPDHSGVSRARNFAEKHDWPIAILNRKPRPNKNQILNIIGEVEGKMAIVVDDIIDTGYRTISSADALIAAGAKDVKACATHGVLSAHASQRIGDSAVSELILTDTVRLKDEDQSDKIKILTVAPMLAEAIEAIQNHHSIH